jgi:hypothetical protein
LQILNNQERQSVPGVNLSKALNALMKVSWTRSSAVEKSPAREIAKALTEDSCGSATVSKEWFSAVWVVVKSNLFILSPSLL